MVKSILLDILIIANLIAIFINTANAACPPADTPCPFGRAEIDGPLLECSGRGRCVSGACQCEGEFADVDCGVLFRRTKLASAFISQGGFDDGPTRYFDIITQVVALLQQEGDFSIPAQEIATECRVAVIKTPDVPLKNVDLTLIEDSIAVKVLNGGIQSSGAFRMKIPKVPLDAAVSTLPLINNCCDGGGNPLQQSSLSCAVPCASSKGAQVSFEMNVIFSANIFPKFNRDTGEITVDVPPEQIRVTFDPPDMGFKLNCNLGQFPELVLDLIDRFIISFGEIVAGQVLNQVRQIADDFRKDFSVTGVRLNITDDIAVDVFIPFGEFVANSHVAIEVEGVFTKNRFKGKNCPEEVITTFVDRTIDGQALPAPNALKEFFWKDDSGSLLRTLFGGRLARSAMTVGVAALMQDNVQLIDTLTNIRVNFGLLDADFLGALDLELPEFGFPLISARSSLGEGDFFEAALSGGAAKLVCNTTGDNLFASTFRRGAINLRPLLLGELEDFEAAFTGTADANFKATLQVFDLDVTQLNLTISAPVNVTIPNVLATGLTDTFLGGSKMEAANDLLKNFAIPIPPELNRLAPGPRIESLHDVDQPGTDQKNGFFQFSTRCLCNAPESGSTPAADAKSDIFFVVESKKFGSEVVPRCITPCVDIVNGGRLLSDATTPSKAIPARQYFENLRNQQIKRLLQEEEEEGQVASNTTDFLATNQCGASLEELKKLTSAILICAQRTDAASTAPLTAKAQCMVEIAATGLDGVSNPVSACDAANQQFSTVRACQAPAKVLLKDLFGQNCFDGRAFNCDDTLERIFQDTCTCHDNPTSPVCSDSLTPLLILGAGWAIPFGFLLILGIGVRFVEGCCLSRFVGSEEETVVTFFRVSPSRQDKYFMGLSAATVISLAALSVGWVFEDPVRIFVGEILKADVFRDTQWVTTSFDEFALGWSLAIMFSLAFAGSSLSAMLIYSGMVGRCGWLTTVGSQAYLRGNGEWFIPSERTTQVWNRNALKLQWLNRFASFLLITAIFAPPAFVQVRKSVLVSQPQFDPFIDQSNADPQDLIFANLTSLATSRETLDLIGQALGFTLMSSFLGFLSSLVLLIVQAVVPAAFCTASVALYWIDVQQRQNMDAHGDILRESSADKNRWKRTLHFFAWCAHTGGAFGSLVGAILVYQTLRAPASWAFIWIFSWILTVPAVILLVRNKGEPSSGKRRLLLAVTYSLAFFVLTITLVSLAPPNISFASPLAIIFFVAVYLYSFLSLISEYCNLGSSSTAVLMGGGRIANNESASSSGRSKTANGYEVGYTFSTMPTEMMMGGGAIKKIGNDQQPFSRVKSIMVSRNPNNPTGNNYQAGNHNHGVGRFQVPQYTFEERDYNLNQEGSFNPAFSGGGNSGPANGGGPIGMVSPFILPPLANARRSAERSWAPPVWSPMANPMLPVPGGFQAPAFDANPYSAAPFDSGSLRRAADRVSTRYGLGKNTRPGSATNFQEDPELKSRISRRLQSRGMDPSMQADMADRISAFAAMYRQTLGGANKTGDAGNQLTAHNSSYNGSSGITATGLGRKQDAKHILQTAVARSRQSIAHWGEDRVPPAPEPGQKRTICNNVVVDVLLERKEKRENTYGLRVVPFRRLFFFIGLIMLLVILINSSVDPLSSDGLKLIAFDAMLSLIITQDSVQISDDLSEFDFAGFDELTAALDPPLDAYVELANIAFGLLWVVFGFFFISFVLEVAYSRLGSNLEVKRKGIRRARLFSFAQLPFLFIAVVIPSSADYVSIALGGIQQVVPLCAEDFDRLVFSTLSNLFGLAMGGLLAVQTMLVLLLVVPSVQRALAFVVAKEIFDISQVPENSKAFSMGEKRLKIARFLWRSFPFMSPILLYIPTILIAQVVAKEYSSILVYSFYVLPIITARLRWKNATKDQKPFRWILFSTVWTSGYFIPLGVIGLVEILNIDQVGFLADLVLTNPIFYVTVLAEICLAIVVMSDVLYMFIASDEEAEADLVIDQYMEVIQEEAVADNGQRYGGRV